MAAIDKILADISAAKSLDENYTASIASADKYLAEKNYDLARNDYSKACGLKPAEKYPITKIAEIDVILAGIAKQKAIDDEYAAIILNADKLLVDKSFDLAKGQYQAAALALKPAAQYPREKIAEIDLALAELATIKDRESKYAAFITNADNLLTRKSYAPARAEYANAASLKPLETYPKEKIAEIDKALADLAAEKALNDKYAGIIAGADKLLAAKTFDQAKSEYQNAGKLKPAENYPKEKIAEIDKILADIAAANTLDENYKATLVKADQLLASKTYDLSRGEYLKASDLKPTEQYPKTKIAEIDVALAAIAKQKALEDEYNAIIVTADKLLAEKSLEPAKTQYLASLKIKPSEQYPKEKIAEIDKALAELASIKERDDQYAAAILNADNLLTQKSYVLSKTAYLNASSIKPKEAYPRDKIGEIDKILADIAAAKALDDKYAGMIAGADKLLAAKTYDQAKSEYQNAGNLKPAENYPKEKIAEIDKILADIESAKILDANYKTIISKADQLLAAKTYDLAKTEYSKAAEMKPTETYPKTRIAEIDAALAAIAKQLALEASRLKAVEDQYSAAISGADKLFLAKTYDLAKNGYLEAGRIKPAEQYPKDKILEINDILAAIAKQKALDDQYRALLAKADQLLIAKTYDQAKLEYTNALNLKPAEQYPKDKIAEIDRVLAEFKAREDAYKASLASADQLLAEKKYEESRTEYENALVIKPQATYPKEKIAEINKALEDLVGKQKYYENLVAAADNSFKDKDYVKAKDSYQQALAVFPAQPYPQAQINIITARVDSLYRANKSFYDKAIANGDRSFNSFEFDKAVDFYIEASALLPMEKYPREMILKIRKTIEENAIADVLKTSVIITSNNEKQFPFTPVNIASRKNNFVYIKIKNLSGKSFNVLMRYGKDKQANGGVVMRNLNIEGKVNERLVSVTDQDLWYREDNNWISLSPQGGDVEVSFIQVSRAK
ncbi:MAG: hypothetical protein NTW16_14505 [Bacteroidetes bacterium]|nr:hypothetical protein [Bacteroidota bacterium]